MVRHPKSPRRNLPLQHLTNSMTTRQSSLQLKNSQPNQRKVNQVRDLTIASFPGKHRSILTQRVKLRVDYPLIEML
jgi:hypothetical protein